MIRSTRPPVNIVDIAAKVKRPPDPRGERRPQILATFAPPFAVKRALLKTLLELFKIADDALGGSATGIPEAPGRFLGMVETPTNKLIHAFFLAGFFTGVSTTGLSDFRQTKIRHYRSSDSGATWSFVEVAWPFRYRVGNVAVAADDQKVHAIFLNKVTQDIAASATLTDNGAATLSGAFTARAVNEGPSGELSRMGSSSLTITNRSLKVDVRALLSDEDPVSGGAIYEANVVKTHVWLIKDATTTRKLGEFTADTTIILNSQADYDAFPLGTVTEGTATQKWALEYLATQTDGMTWPATATRVDEDDPDGTGREGLAGETSTVPQPASLYVDPVAGVHIMYGFDGYSITPQISANRLDAVYYRLGPTGTRVVLDQVTGAAAAAILFRTPFRICANDTGGAVAAWKRRQTASIMRIDSSVPNGTVSTIYTEAGGKTIADFQLIPRPSSVLMLFDESAPNTAEAKQDRLHSAEFSSGTWSAFTAIADATTSIVGVQNAAGSGTGGAIRGLMGAYDPVLGSTKPKQIWLFRSDGDEVKLLDIATDSPAIDPSVGPDDKFELSTLATGGNLSSGFAAPPVPSAIAAAKFFSVLLHTKRNASNVVTAKAWYCGRVTQP